METISFKCSLIGAAVVTLLAACNVNNPASEEQGTEVQDPEGTVYYEADTVTNFMNPERGFYRYTDIHLKGDGTGGLYDDMSYKENCESSKISLLFRYYYLDCYNEGQPIAQADLDLINRDLSVIRKNGKKVIVRFSYGSSGYKNDNNWSFTEPTKEGMLAHMKQLKPVLAANADVIAAVQAGFVGIWGEWYFTSTFGKDWSKPNAKADRNDIINGLLDMAPADRFVQVRTVHYITEYMGNGTRDYTNVLTDATAFSGTPQSRIGLHNDAYCNDRTNCGTYYDYAAERQYLANLGQYAPLGGETNGGTESFYKGEKAMADMILLHFDYMNSNYETGVLNNWRKGKPEGSKLSYYDLMASRMGYRFQLESFYAAVNGNQLPIIMKIYNKGFSNVYNRRIAYIVLKNDKQTYSLPLTSDPRFWKSGTTTRIEETLNLPQGIVAGSYQLYLALPDVYESIAANPDYAIRLANKNMKWENGLNDLGITIEIK